MAEFLQRRGRQLRLRHRLHSLRSLRQSLKQSQTKAFICYHHWTASPTLQSRANLRFDGSADQRRDNKMIRSFAITAIADIFRSEEFSRYRPAS